jgi:hypothetical protein
MRIIAPLLISALYLATAVAQDDAPEEELAAEELRHYTVEVIVFSYAEDVSIGSEIFLPDESPVEEEPLVDAEGNLLVEDEEPVPVYDTADNEFDVEEPLVWSVGYGEGIDEDSGPEDDKLRLVLLDEEEFVLSNAIRQFELLDAYETILHVGWTQPVYPLEETPAIELWLLAEPPEGLDGSFTLYLSRYLHIIVDLALAAAIEVEDPVVTDDSAFSFGDSRTLYEDRYDSAPPPVRYRIQEHRIVKNGELRYFDHPKFGVLAKVTRVEEEEKEDDPDAEAVSDPLPGNIVE